MFTSRIPNLPFLLNGIKNSVQNPFLFNKDLVNTPVECQMSRWWNFLYRP